MKTKNPTKKRKGENCENHGEQRIEADLCTGDLESNQSTLELQVQALGEKGGREGKPIVHLGLTISLFCWRI